MKGVSRVGLVVLTVVSAACSVSVTTKDRFTESNYVVNDTQPWNGEQITIKIDGVPVAESGGVHVIADSSTTTLTATARLLAMADTDDKASADLTTAEVKGTFAWSRPAAGQIELDCHHGSTHGSSDGSYSGCEFVEVHVPLGTAAQPLSVTAESGNGTLTLDMGTTVIGTVGANATGATCDIAATLPATQGGNISLVSAQAGNITLTLPTAFSADKVTLEADPGKTNVGPFTDITQFGGGAFQARGTVGAGLATLNVVSDVFAGESGTITLAGD